MKVRVTLELDADDVRFNYLRTDAQPLETVIAQTVQNAIADEGYGLKIQEIKVELTK